MEGRPETAPQQPEAHRSSHATRPMRTSALLLLAALVAPAACLSPVGLISGPTRAWSSRAALATGFTPRVGNRLAMCIPEKLKRGQPGYKRAAIKYFLRKTFTPGQVRKEEALAAAAAEKKAYEERRAAMINRLRVLAKTLQTPRQLCPLELPHAI